MNFLFITGYISTGIIRAVCWTLLHSLWQGLIAAAIGGLIILATRHSKAALRYNLLSFVFICFLICALITFLYQPGIIHLSFTSNNKVYVLPASPGNVTVNEAGGEWASSLQKKTFFQPIIYYGNKYSTLITGLWAIFFFARFLSMISGLRHAYRLRYLHTIGPAQEWKERLHTLCSLLGIHNRILLKESGIINVPVVVGFLKPVILVPLGMFANLSVEQVETIFVHELAHVRRKDFGVNLLQRLAESFFFFNPFILWMSSFIREEREACCDDIVLEYTPDKKSYLEALVSFREAETAARTYAMALGSRNNLLNRAKRILTNENKRLNAMEKITLILVVLAVTAFGFIPDKKDSLPILRKPASTVALPLNIQAEYRATVVEKVSGPLEMSDTMPGRSLTFKNILTYNNDDGEEKISEVSALGSDGKKYSYKIVNDEIKEFSINGVSVGKGNFKKYGLVIEKIENIRGQNMNTAGPRPENNLNLLQDKQELMKEELWQLQQGVQANQNLDLLKTQQKELQNNNQLLLERKLNLQNEMQTNHGLDLLKTQQKELQNNNQLLLERKLNLQDELQVNQGLDLLKTQQKELLNNNQLLLERKLNLQNEIQTNLGLDLLTTQQKELLNKNQLLFELKLNLPNEIQAKNQLELLKSQHVNLESQLVHPNDQVGEIVSDLSEAGIIKDKTELSFTLNYDELIVNGKKQETKLHAKLKERYIKSPKDHYIYKTNGHYTSSDVVRE
ncbi:MAG: peptidase BlaR1 [Chitinophagaceae bacterium]|nr:peptidase BlaR1 [Chitinophagaceae bacterium]